MEAKKKIKPNKYLSTVGFLNMLKQSFSSEEAYQLAAKGFANFMIENYKLIFEGTSPGSQERFDRLRKNYEDAAAKKDYLEIVKSDSETLEVRYDRCPFCEVMKGYGLEDLASAYCQSDRAFTKKLLPGVKFTREKEISKGDKACEFKWVNSRG